MPDWTKAKVAIVKIFELFDRVPQIDNWNDKTGLVLPTIDGEIEFRAVEFSYPTRKEVKVLNNLNITIGKGQKIALVGSSGCGKSTVTQLLERFYGKRFYF
jgi:ABC-type bacteriocin/lantibiotic exporter with double-glycine peptidase domain